MVGFFLGDFFLFLKGFFWKVCFWEDVFYCEIQQLDGCILKHVSNHPYLGVEFSESLTFSVHIANIVSSACQKLGFRRRNLKRCPRDVKALAYYALVRSKLEYCCAIWDPHQVGEVNKLVQRNAARFVCGEYRRGPGISVTALLKELQWPSLADRR